MNSEAVASPNYKLLSGGTSIQNIPHRPGYLSGSSGYIHLSYRVLCSLSRLQWCSGCGRVGAAGYESCLFAPSPPTDSLDSAACRFAARCNCFRPLRRCRLGWHDRLSSPRTRSNLPTSSVCAFLGLGRLFHTAFSWQEGSNSSSSSHQSALACIRFFSRPHGRYRRLAVTAPAWN